MELLHHLGELAGLVQSSYTPAGYSRLSFRFQGIRCQGVSSLLGLAVNHRQSSCLASIILVATNVCYSGVGFRNKKFLRDGVLASCPTLLFHSRLGPVGYTQNGYIQAESQRDINCR